MSSLKNTNQKIRVFITESDSTTMQEYIDKLLDRMIKVGYSNLSAHEKNWLERINYDDDFSVNRNILEE
jgi:hypothetical protein